MSNYVWLSTAKQESALIQRVNVEIHIDDPDKLKEIEGQELNQNGMPVPPELCPKRIWGDGSGSNMTKMPDLFWAMSQWIVSERAADVIRQFDLGGGSLYPVTEGVFQSDNITPVRGNYFCWIFGNAKNAFLPEASKNVEPPAIPGLWWDMPWKPQDNDIAVSQAALSGADVWLDPMLFKSLFLSSSLGDALDQAGMRKSFRLYKCRVS